MIKSCFILYGFDHYHFHRLSMTRNIDDKPSAVFIAELSVKILGFFVYLR